MTNASVISVRPGESRISTTDLPSSLSWFGFGAAGNQRKDKIQRQTVVRNARAPPRRTPRRAAPRREGEAHVPRASLAMGVLVRQRARSRRRPARVPSSERFSSVHSSPLPLASSRVGDQIDDPPSGRVVRLTPPTPPSRPAAAAAPTAPPPPGRDASADIAQVQAPSAKVALRRRRHPRGRGRGVVSSARGMDDAG
jgi:hypothetical protein